MEREFIYLMGGRGRIATKVICGEIPGEVRGKIAY